MKKVYEKPMILFEDFTMCTNIAAGCDEIITNSTQDFCGYIMSGNQTIFLRTVEGCKFHYDDDPSNPFCYHNPTEDKNLFNS